MRILQAIETSGPGGAEQVLVRLCREFSRLGHHVEALMLKEGWLADRLRKDGVPLTILPAGGGLDRSFLNRLRSHLADSRIDVLHSHEFTLTVYGRLATWKEERVHVATAHGRNFVSGLKRRIAGGCLLRPRGNFSLVACSESLGAHLRRSLLLPERSVRLVTNGVPLAEGSRPTTHEAGQPLRLVAVGNLYPVKNHGLLIRVVDELRRREIGTELDILGRGGEEARLARLIDELRLADVVRLQGFRPDVGRFFSAAHLFVSGSLSEGMPLSFLEAMGSGLPVVAPRVGGIPEIVEDGTHGLLYDSGDVRGAADAIARLAGDERLRARLGRQAASTVRTDYSVQTMAERYMGLYRNLVRNGSADHGSTGI